MRNFKNNEPLLQNIKDNDVKEIKRVLIDNIMYLQGNRSEINKAIQYALDNSNFIFDKHQDIAISDRHNKESYFSEEQFNLKENYSRERFNVLVDLYNEVYANKKYIYESEPVKGSNNLIKVVVAVGVAAAAAYLLFKILD